MNQQRKPRTYSTYSYLRDVLRAANSWLEDAERNAKGDPALGNVLEHVKTAHRQTSAAIDMMPRTTNGGQS